MLGAIIGDIIGSRWEFRRMKSKDFPLFSDGNTYTDDSIMTVAVADSLLNGVDPAESMRTWARKIEIPRLPGIGGYGQKFFFWLAAPDIQPPYNSYGNGGAMRVSPAAFLADSLDQALDNARQVTMVSHDHPEGLKGAMATAHAIYLAMDGYSSTAIRASIADAYDYDLSRNIDEIRKSYQHTEAAQGSVPESIICALEASNFEDAIRNAVSMGGDADTMAAIAGGLAEVLYGIPVEIKESGLNYLHNDMKAILTQQYRSKNIIL